MEIKNYDEYILYTTAVDNLLLRKQLAPVCNEGENTLIKYMLESKWHYTDCVKAIINYRIESSV